jgi:purine-binding chemotaxis protein CheW
MNLSEIRKKAQQERQEGQEQAVASLPNTVAASAELSSTLSPPPVVPAVTAPIPVADPASAMSAQERVGASVRGNEWAHGHFDPVSLILSGRHDALEADEVESVDMEGTTQGHEEYEECLCFRVATERYAISIMEIKEITKPREMTEVPRVPSFVLGVISLRGVIVPIFDLGQRLQLPPVTATGKARIIVVKKGEDLSGILVDEVIQVVKVPLASIEQPPAVLEGIDREFVRGIGRHDGNMLILLHLGKILDLSLT